MSFDKFLTKVFGSSNQRYLKSVLPIVDKINALEASVKAKSDEELRARKMQADLLRRDLRWHHVVAIFTSAASAMTFMNGVDCRIGYLATYTANMSSLNLAGAQNIYNNWVGAPALQLIEANVVTISEFEAKGYSYDWAIQPAG